MKQNDSCGVVQDLLPLYVDGVASEQSRALVEAHVEGCVECAGLCAQMRDQAAGVTPQQADEATVGHAWKQLVRAIRRKHLRIILLVVLALLVGFAGLMTAYDRLYRVARTAIPPEALSLVLVQTPEGRALTRFTRKDSMTIVPRITMSYDEADDVLYYEAFRPLLSKGEAEQTTPVTFLDDGLCLEEGILYQETEAQGRREVREIRIGTAQAYETAWRQGESIPSLNEWFGH